ncbi:MAG: pur operon repressor [Dehalobacter sp. 4CP]|uniref:pur operon repressor n=1 Tax=Dehalobacter sp. CP TaxID=2594474 RepID=UPI0013CAE83F|nr:pur operon repressor [Dehalobacter sp.]NBJ16091.1 pur operon repressor [Dehalobacter sp. 4CP]
MKRIERMIALTEILISHPNELLTLGFFADRFDTARSTISEDLVAIKESLTLTDKGNLDTISGAAGGVKYLPGIGREEAKNFLTSLAGNLNAGDRTLPGGFLYMSDILYNPIIARKLGLIFASVFRKRSPEAVITIETKGIPLALMTADALGVPAVVVQHGNKVTEGSSVSINYISGSSKRIQTMSLTRKALGTGKKVLIIDDFIKAGGTAKGLIDLMQEFDAKVVGLGILMEDTLWNNSRLVEDYLALLQLEIDSSKGRTFVKANDPKMM